MAKNLLPYQQITKISNDRPAAVPSLWNNTYGEIDANFKAISDFIGTSNTRLRMYVGTPVSLADNAFSKVSPSDAIMVGDIVAAPDGKLYKVSAVDESKFTLTDTSLNFKGIHELASNDEATAGAIDTKALTPKGAKAMIDKSLSETVKDATEDQKGIVELASSEEVTSGKDNTKAITPKTFADTLKSLGYRKMPAGTLISVLTKATVPPEGFLFLDGSKIPKADYPTLVALGIFTEEEENLVLPNWDGRVGQTTNTPELVGTTIEDSVPNISGWADAIGYSNRSVFPNGVFSNSIDVDYAVATKELNEKDGGESIYFEARDGNAKYIGEKVQPSVFLHRTLIAY